MDLSSCTGSLTSFTKFHLQSQLDGHPLNYDMAEPDVEMEMDNIFSKWPLVGDKVADKSHPFGSLLDLACKLRQAEYRRRTIVNMGQLLSSNDALSSSYSVTRGRDSDVGIKLSIADCTSSAGFHQMQSAVHSVATGHANQYNTVPSVIRSNLSLTGSSTGTRPGQKVISYTLPSVSSMPALPSEDSQTLHSTTSPAAGSDDPDIVLSERRKHHCHMCSYQTDNRSHLRRHQSTVHNTCKMYHCYVCKTDFSRSERAKAHFLSIHPEIPYHSKLVRKRASDTTDDNTDVLMSTGDVYRPNEWTAKKNVDANSKTAARKSWEKYCQLVPPSGNVGCHFQCIRCSHIGPDIWHLKRHYLDVHSGARAYACRVCRYSTGDVQRLISHMTGHGELFCHNCSFSTVEMERFNTHLAVCDGHGEAQCPICGDNFADRASVKQHVMTVYNRDYCETCACVIYSPDTMEEHQRQHVSSDVCAADSETLLPISSSLTDHKPTLESDRHSSYAGSCHSSADPNCDDMNASSELMGGASEDGTHQARYRFGRFSNQTYYCNVEGCTFKATWKKSVELHTLNYHNDNLGDEQASVRPSSPDTVLSTPMSTGYGFFSCPFCPNSRSFKYRKSYEKHLLQHGIDYAKHPYLVVRSAVQDTSLVGTAAMV